MTHPNGLNHPNQRQASYRPQIVTNGQKENYPSCYPIQPAGIVPNGARPYSNRHPNTTFQNGTSGGGGGNGFHEIGLDSKPFQATNVGLINQINNMTIRP